MSATVDIDRYQQLSAELQQRSVTLVAVSKTQPVEKIMALYELGQRDFGENYVQELLDKHAALPADIRWHFIGHLQTNKIKFIAPFVHLVHGVDSPSLLSAIGKQAVKINRPIDVLLQIHIAEEETKFGLNESELDEIMKELPAPGLVRVKGLMGMASFSDDTEKVGAEFSKLRSLFDRYISAGFNILSMGMSADYKLALARGSTLVRIGSMLFGERGNN